MTLFPRLGVAEINTPWPFRYPLLVKMSISIASSLRLSGTGMTSLNLRFLLLNCQMIVYLSRPAKSPDLGQRLSAFSLHFRLTGFDVHFSGEIENLPALFFSDRSRLFYYLR